MKTVSVAGLLILTVVILGGCVAGPNTLVNVPNEDGTIAGFWLGLWHGIIAPVTFVISLFSDAVHVYEVHNNGSWYTFGFLLGIVSIWGGGGSRVASRRR